MTNQELNARAAEIMGWRQVHSINDETDIVKSLNSPMVLQRQDGVIIYALEEDLDTPIWNPCENIAQAMLLFHKFGGMDILTSGDGKTFQARERYTAHCRANWCSSNERTVELAIVYAAIAAAAWGKK